MKLPNKLHRSLSTSPPPSSPPSPGGSAASLPSSPSKKQHRFPFPGRSRSKKSAASSSPPEISAASSPSPSTSSSHRSHRNGKAEACEPSFASLSVRHDKGKMSESSMQEIQQVFAQFDRNGDGKISAEELRTVLVSLGDETTSDEAKMMVREVDMDGDGFLDLDEFVQLNSRCLHGATEEEEMQAAFAIFDLDKNGYISAEELQTVLGRLGGSLAERTSVEDCKRMIRGVDRKGVGYVDFDDFKRMMTPLTF